MEKVVLMVLMIYLFPLILLIKIVHQCQYFSDIIEIKEIFEAKSSINVNIFIK